MKLNRVVVLLAVWLPFVTFVRAKDESLASIFSNKPDAHPTIVPRRASIILIACHGLGLGDLSCYGQTNFQTPNLDRLAAEGTRFTGYRTTSDDFSEAEGALMAGKTAAFSAGESTVAARLQQVGYHTGLIGEWTLGSEPWTQGFEEFTGFLNESDARNYYADSIWRYMGGGVANPTNHPFARHDRSEAVYNNIGGRKGRFIPDLFFTAMGNFVRRNQPDFANHFRPFFLLLNMPAPESAATNRDEYPVPTDAPFTGENWPQAAKNRAAMLARLDAGVGRLLEQLQQSGMTNNVAIFLTGAVAPPPFADTNLNFLKVPGEARGGISEDRLRVPMVVRWPGHVPAGRVSAEPWSAPDFAPTALQIGYGKLGADFTGRSILPELLGGPATNAPSWSDRPDHP